MTTRNNQDRINTEAGSNVDSQQTNQQAHTLAFSVPTEFVDLPSRGQYYPKGHALHGVSQLEIKHMTAKEEDLLSNEDLIRKGVVIDRLLQNVVVTPNVDIADMLAGDKSALIIAARITGYGSDYSAVVTCPACGTKSEKHFDLTNHKTIGAVFDADTLNENLEGVRVTEYGTFVTTLPRTGFEVEFRMLTGKDEERISKFQKKNTSSGTLIDTLAMLMVSVDGVTDRMQISEFAGNMPAMDSKFLRTLYQKLVPNVDLKQEFVCAKCNHEQDLEVPITAGFFWPQS